MCFLPLKVHREGCLSALNQTALHCTAHCTALHTALTVLIMVVGNSRPAARCGGRRHFLPPVFAVAVVVLLHVVTTHTASAADTPTPKVESSWEEEYLYSTAHLLRKRHELSPLAREKLPQVRGAAAATARDDDDDDVDDLRVVRAMQWAAETSDATERRGMAQIAGSCAAAPQARGV